MNVTAPRVALLALVDACRACASKKTQMPILENLLLIAEIQAIGGKLQVAGTDLYVTLTGVVDADIAKPGTIAVSAAGLAERIKSMPDGPVQIVQVKEGTAEIRAPGTKRHFSMPCTSATDFPRLPAPSGEAVKTTIDVGLLETLIARTSFAISLDSTRPHVNSLLLKFGQETLTAVATDGHRLAKAIAPFAGGKPDEWLVPFDAVGRLRDFLGAVPRPKKKAGDEASPGPATVGVQRDRATVFFTSAERTFSFKLVDAQFPPYDQVIPTREHPVILAPREALIGVIRAVALSSGKTGGVKIECVGGKLMVSVDDSEKGKASDEVIIETKDTEHRMVGISSKYMVEAFGAIDTDQVSLDMDGELDPILIRAAGETLVKLDLVVMPMRI